MFEGCLDNRVVASASSLVSRSSSSRVLARLLTGDLTSCVSFFFEAAAAVAPLRLLQEVALEGSEGVLVLAIFELATRIDVD